ncbi:MAG: acetate--CoA ligase family protein [Hyphomicrobiaceae bacterium]
MNNLNAFFNPDRIAVIGASSNPSKIGGRRFRTLIEGDFKGEVFPVNPGAATVQGRQAYRSLDDIPGSIDLAIIAVHARLVPQMVSACAHRRIPAVMIITAGFGEQSKRGSVLEQKMVAELAASGGRLMGPNCAGLYDQMSGMNLSGMTIPPGPIGLVSQSGNIVLDMVLHARDVGTGLSRYASVGNSAHVRATDVIENLLDDPASKVVVGYIEGWGDGEGRHLCDLARSHSSRKPIVILKPGRSEEGQQAALSHTGALAGNDRVTDAAFRSAGIWRAGSPGEAVNVAAALVRYPRLSSNRVAILTDGGGHATLLADALGVAGFSLAKLDGSTIEALSALLPERCALANPIDFAGAAEEQPDVISHTIEICSRAQNVDAVALVGHFGGYHDNGGEEIGRQEIATAELIVNGRRPDDAPLVLQSIHANGNQPALEYLKNSGINVVRSPLELSQILQALAVPLPDHQRQAVTPVVRQSSAERGLVGAHGTDRALLEPEARTLLARNGFAVPDWRVSANPKQLGEQCAQSGFENVVLKLIQPRLVHRSDAGGVVLNVKGSAEIVDEAARLLDRAGHSKARDATVMATAMIAPGIELVFGAMRDTHFGPVVVFGLGGVYTEALDDVAVHPAPLHEDAAASLISEIQGASLLFGYRGGPAIDIQTAARLLVQLADVLVAYPDIDAIDLNPVILNEDGLTIADARIILSETSDLDH